MKLAIETNGLTKRYGDVLAVDSVDLRVRPGEIYGFLGLNGAGKTTSIRALLGMIRPSAGDVRVLDEAVGANGGGPWGQVGHLVESPSAYPELTARENLEIARHLHGISDPGATSSVIERLGLASYADRRAGTLSMGNLQRLGLARALLHEPELLILDEPANGLDPAGVVEIRELLRSLANEKGVTVFMSSHILTEVDRLANEKGVTVFMSSHILTEVDRLATRIGIIHKGRLIEELDTDALEKLRSKRLEVRTRDLQAARASLQSAGYPSSINDGTIIIRDESVVNHPDEIACILVNAGTPPIHLVVEQEDLEDYFLRLTSDPIVEQVTELA